MTVFVWTKIGPEAGEKLDNILARKEIERAAGDGVFWWGIGSSLGSRVRSEARSNGGTLPILFTFMRARPKAIDMAPDEIWRWTTWEDEAGRLRDIPSHVLITSRGHPKKRGHYALVCRSDSRLDVDGAGKRFDPSACYTLSGKRPGASQVTALVDGPCGESPSGPYEICFIATLIDPWAVRLARPLPA